MTPYQAYVLFLAMKRHWTSDSYDFHKYAGKTNASLNAFENRNDKHFFGKLSKHPDLQGFLLACFTRFEAKSVYPSSIAYNQQYQQAYVEWQKQQEAIEYYFKQEINTLHKEDFVVKDGDYPEIIVQYFDKKISLETLCILNRELKIFDYLDKKLNDTIVWPDVRNKALKYQNFVKYDRVKIRKIMKDQFED